MIKINITLQNYNEALNKFNTNLLDNDLDQFIFNNCKHVTKKEKISLIINSDNLNIEQQNQLKSIIHNYYRKEYNHFKKIDQYHDYFRGILLILGIIFIFLSEIFFSVVKELFLIAGWVVIWEIVYDILFSGIKRKKEKMMYKKLAKCQIEFNNNL